MKTLLPAKFTSLVTFVLLLTLSVAGRAQVSSFTENFGDGSGDGNTVVLPTGWSTINLSQSATTTISGGTPGPWSSYSTSADGPAGLGLIITPPGSDASYALDGFAASSDSDFGVEISDWLITPYLNLSNGATLTFLTQVADVPASDMLEVALAEAPTSTAAYDSLNLPASGPASTGLFLTNLLTLGTSTPAVGDPDNYPQTTANGGWVTETLTLSGLPAGTTTGNIAFRYESTDDSNDSYIGVADVAYSQGTTSPAAPEPSTVALMIVAGAALLLRYRGRLIPS